MALLKIKLSRNLRKHILRGHPWVYQDSIQAPSGIQKAQLCLVMDQKEEVAWAYYDPHSPLALRILSSQKTVPKQDFFIRRFDKAFSLRESLLANQNTNAYRLFNGEGDLLPGLICDVYDHVGILQFDGRGPSEFWDRDLIANWLLQNKVCTTVIEKPRGGSEDRSLQLIAGPQIETTHVVLENTRRFEVDFVRGQKTGFFLDQRDNREFVASVSQDQNVLNLFSYSGGFSIYAGSGGAQKVVSVDISSGAVQQSQVNWELNGLKPSVHEAVCADVFDYLKQEAKSFEHIIVDPPSMTHSAGQKKLAMQKYAEVFAAAARKVKAGGFLSLSSCSSHISFADFFEIINETMSMSRRTGQILRVSGQGVDHPFPHILPEMRYLKFVHLALD